MIVSEGIEETTLLEFKRQLPAAGQNDDLAKDISGMANTDGGVIIYGIEEEYGVAKSLSPFDIAGAAERVAQVALSQIDEGVIIASTSVIRDEDQSSLGYLVVEVALSARRPHFTKGAAWGRSPRHNFPLSRRQIGELFARSEGFAQEFGLVQSRPGRVKAVTSTEPRPGTVGSTDAFLTLVNDGDSDVISINLDWAGNATPPAVVVDRLPIERLRYGSEMKFRVSRAQPHTQYALTVRWIDEQGRDFEEIWHVVWS